MSISCTSCNNSFLVTAEDIALLEKIRLSLTGGVAKIPPPTLCPACRQLRRVIFRNDQNYYRNSCNSCKKQLISIYSPDKGIPVLCEECYWGDRWDPLSFGVSYEPGHSFFEQFANMKAKVPRLAIFNTQSENSKYTVHSSKNKDCYMCSSTLNCEGVHYSDFIQECRDSHDLFSCKSMELCYECTYSNNCFSCDFLEHSQELSDSYLCFDCRSGNLLVGCAGTRRESIKILNQSSTAAECKKTIERLKRDSNFRKEFLKSYSVLKASVARPAVWRLGCENALGDNLLRSRNIRDSFNIKDCEDLAYAYEGFTTKDSMDMMRVGSGELLYECAAIVSLKFSAFCNLCYDSSYLLYCDNCQNNTRNCFGCMSLKQNEFCILNVQYSQDEYYELLNQIIEDMKRSKEFGEFFPTSLSPFGYNESKASEWFPRSKEEVVKRGWQWSDFDPPTTEGLKIISNKELPELIEDVSDDILNCAIRCEVSGKPFRVIAPDLKFYRGRGVSIPKLCAKERQKARIQAENPRVLIERSCEECHSPVQTTYPVNRPEKLLCDRCYELSRYSAA